ncbi:TrkH family potassium uptake protein [bacterium]|nr:TrkH family potassium uptake protein [bacterium]
MPNKQLKFQTFHVVLNNLGALFIVLCWVLLLPLVILFLYEEIGEYGYQTLLAFIIPSITSLFLGFALKTFFRKGTPNVIQAMLICSLGWLGCSAIGAIPFVIGIKATYLNAYFETMSGFTTTGITMFTGLDQMPHSILFWRSLTQWLGGLGILTFFLAVTYQASGAHRLFGAESHKFGAPRPVPGLANTVKILWSIYIGYTAFIVIALFIAKMPFFDSLCHTFTALSTGGFSPHDASIEFYRLTNHPNYIWFEYIIIAGMLMGGINFFIHYRFYNEGPRALMDNTEMKYWWGMIGLFVLVILGERFFVVNKDLLFNPQTAFTFKQFEENFRITLFQVVSILTTTGFGTRDIGSPYFGTAARQLFLIMMVIGGCIGSTGGGFKVLRVSILFKLVKREVYRILGPRRAISNIIIDGKPVEQNEIKRITSLFFLWILFLCIGGMITGLFSKLDGYTSLSGMFSALGNIGPCFIPVKEMAQLHPVIKITYILGMLAGRLEIIPLLLLFSRKAWSEQ